MRRFIFLTCGFLFLCSPLGIGYCQTDGFIKNGEQVLFPIDFYEHPQDIDQLRRMAENGVNMVHCQNRQELDQAASVGLLGAVPVPLQGGATEDFKNLIRSLADSPALAVWEGPDEVVWNFTAASMLFREQGVHHATGEWQDQTDNALEYAKRQAAEIMPKMKEAAQAIRELDARKRPIWINEASRSDMIYTRQYLDFIDVTGCDLYPVNYDKRPIHQIGLVTDRWVQVGRGKPVWMVLQAFAWSELGDYYGGKETAYPSFAESRFMAYDAIAHGAKGILYWGSSYSKSDELRGSIYALIRELAALQSFLIAPPEIEAKTTFIDIVFDETDTKRGVKTFVRRCENDWIVVLVNEDNRAHLGIEIQGLNALDGRAFELLYGNEQIAIERGTLMTRMKPYEVKVFATGKKWENLNTTGRGYSGM